MVACMPCRDRSALLSSGLLLYFVRSCKATAHAYLLFVVAVGRSSFFCAFFCVRVAMIVDRCAWRSKSCGVGCKRPDRRPRAGPDENDCSAAFFIFRVASRRVVSCRAVSCLSGRVAKRRVEPSRAESGRVGSGGYVRSVH